MMINAVPVAKGISEQFLPHEIVTGWHLYLNHLKAQFGEYIEASIDADVTNDTKGKTHPYISLGPIGNWKGYQMRFDLEPGKMVLRRNIKRLSIP